VRIYPSRVARKMNSSAILSPLTITAELTGKLPMRRRMYGNFFKAGMWFSIAVAISLITFLIGFIFYRGLGNLNWSMLTSTRSALHQTVGVLPNIIYTFYTVFTTLIIALPVGIGAAIYLNEYAKSGSERISKKRAYSKPNRIRRRTFVVVRIIEFGIELLAGIPSIVYGLLGFMVFVQITGGMTVLAGSLTLSILILPMIVRTTQEALRTVPDSYRFGSAALGATKWHTVRTIILPGALDGVVTGIILAIGRIVGESAALLVTAGVGSRLVTNYFDALQVSGATLTVALYSYAYEPGNWGGVSGQDVAFAIAALLVIIVLTLNLLTKLLKKFLKKG